MTLIRDCAWWLFCWACWRIYTWMPCRLVPNGWELWLLPHAGQYAYSIGWADFRDTCAWNRAGKPRNWQWKIR